MLIVQFLIIYGFFSGLCERTISGFMQNPNTLSGKQTKKSFNLVLLTGSLVCPSIRNACRTLQQKGSISENVPGRTLQKELFFFPSKSLNSPDKSLKLLKFKKYVLWKESFTLELILGSLFCSSMGSMPNCTPKGLRIREGSKLNPCR